MAEVKSNLNGSIGSVITAVPQAGHYQVLKFDSLGKLLSKATCSDVKDELSCNVIVPSFCHQFMSNSGAKNSEDLRSKVNSCRKLTTSFERSKAYDAKIDMEKALVNSSEALRSSHLNKSNTVLRAVVDQKFKLNYTADVEIGIFDMVEMAEDCARFEDQGVFPPRAAAQGGEKIKVQ